MYKHFVRLARMILLVAAVSVLSGCGDTVTLYYRQIGVCNSYHGTGPHHDAGPNFAYVIVKIEKIDNTHSSIDFHFAAGRLYIRGKNYTDPNAADIVQAILIPIGDWEFFYAQPASDFFTDMGVPLVTSPIIRAGTQTVLDGYLLFRVNTANSNGAVEDQAVNFFLRYLLSRGDPDVALYKTNEADPAKPLTEDCRRITI